MSTISIIIPVYNVEKYISICLDSAVNQTYKDLEIVLINDGSTDTSKQIIEEYAIKDPRIKIINQSNKGISATRNEGIQNSSGEYIVFIDSDDWIDLNTCELALEALRKNNADLVYWSYCKEFGDRTEKKYLENNHKVFTPEETKKLQRRVAGLYKNELQNPENADSLVTVWGKLYKREHIKNIVFLDTKDIGNEDALFNLEALQPVKKAVYIHKCFYHYRKTNNTSFTHTYRPSLFNQWLQLFTLMQKYINQHITDPTFNTALQNRIALSIIGLGFNECANKKVNHFKRAKNIANILKGEKHREALKNLELKYFPVHWKFFFFMAKKKLSLGLYILLLLILKIKK